METIGDLRLCEMSKNRFSNQLVVFYRILLMLPENNDIVTVYLDLKLKSMKTALQTVLDLIKIP